jgi:energy-coupling factor transporter ATP-binding protein EcfA2
MDFELTSGQYKSIKSLQWKEIPEFVVVTGKNGSGKTQLLELLNHHFGTEQQHKNNIARQPTNPFHGVQTVANNCSISLNELVYLSSIWQLGNLGATNASKFTEVINKLYNHITNVANDPTYQELASVIDANIGKPKSQITRNDIQAHLPIDYFDYINKIQIHEGLSEAFLAYHSRYAELRDEEKSNTQIIDELGQAPWEVINNLLKSADFPYIVNKPKVYMGDYHFELISRKDEELIINFSDLSAGEKVLISLGIWMFNASKGKRLPKLLLLDEPDAHLHPSAIKDFIDVIENVLVKKHQVRVILTTHSPSTVSLTPEYALFEMSNDSPQIKPLRSKEYGINLLTEGLIIVKPNIKYVLVEDKNDAKYYNEVFKILKTRNKVKQAIDTIFIPASNKSAGTSGGCTVVRAWVEKFVSEGADDIFQGLMDYDNGSNLPESFTPTLNLHVVSRYSL